MSLLPLFLPPPSLQIWSLTWQKKRTTSLALCAPLFLLTSSLCSTIQVQFSYANILQGCPSFIYGILPTGRTSGDLCCRGHRPFVKLPDESTEQVLGAIRAMRLRGDTGIPPQHSLEGSRIKNSQITTNNDFSMNGPFCGQCFQK